MTAFEQNELEGKIAFLREQLRETDYKCLKHVDGALTDAEYLPIREERQRLRAEINALQAQLNAEVET